MMTVFATPVNDLKKTLLLFRGDELRANKEKGNTPTEDVIFCIVWKCKVFLLYYLEM